MAHLKKQTHTFIPSLLALAVILAIGCTPPESENSAEASKKADYLRTSEELASELQSSLGSKLMAAMERGGPSEAIAVCQEVAQELTEAADRTDPEVTINRTALRVRNPVNAPTALDEKVLKDWKRALNKGLPAKPVVNEAGGNVIVHRPIMTAELCLQYHGPPEQIDEATAQLLQKLYPEDEATGFQAGDLRGAFRIEFAGS